ncbi:MAG: SIS domain-containing protein [Candidatus Asgardarchaeia archaeon]
MVDVTLFKDTFKEIIDHLNHFFKSIDNDSITTFAEYLKKTKRIYVVGIGKTGLIAKTFALSMLSMGYEVFVVGESLMPAPRETDLVIAVSGSGETDYPIKTAQMAKKLGAKVVCITSNPTSTLAQISDFTVVVPGRDPKKQSLSYVVLTAIGMHGTLEGMLFEIAALAFFDSIYAAFCELNQRTKKE